MCLICRAGRFQIPYAILTSFVKASGSSMNRPELAQITHSRSTFCQSRPGLRSLQLLLIYRWLRVIFAPPSLRFFTIKAVGITVSFAWIWGDKTQTPAGHHQLSQVEDFRAISRRLCPSTPVNVCSICPNPVLSKASSNSARAMKWVS